MKLLIRNLARTTTEVELLKIFEAHGPVQSCSLIMDKQTGKSKGFAFIEMPRPGDARAAVKTLNGKNLAGNVIRVKKASPKKATAEKVSPDKAESEKTKAANQNIWSSND
ncbi:MAG: RNA-binding protein [Gammaproteobacteria bacterium]|nr:RNA-binding protein [Gammaproteobacteria bacterium]